MPTIDLSLVIKGHIEAQYNLGQMTEYGMGVQKGSKEAAKWYRLAADQGYSVAQGSLAAMYYNGQGVPQNYVHAYMWLCLSSAQGYEDATKLRDLLAKQLTSAQIAEAQKLASEWKPKK